MGLELYAFSETPRAREIPFVMKSACYVSFYLFVLSFLKPSVVFSCPSPLEGDDCTDFVTICPAGHKCHYGGECTNIGCTCPPGRVGHSCRFSAEQLQNSDGVKKQNEAITVVAVTVSLSFLALLALVFFMVRRERQGMPVFSSSLEVHKDEPTDSRVWLK